MDATQYCKKFVYFITIFLLLAGEIVEEPNPPPNILSSAHMTSTSTSKILPILLTSASRSSSRNVSPTPPSSFGAELCGGEGESSAIGECQEGGELSATMGEPASKRMKPSPIVWGQQPAGACESYRPLKRQIDSLCLSINNLG